MVTITPKVIPILMGCEGFNFQTESCVDGTKDLTAPDEQMQDQLIEQLFDIMEGLWDKPCEIDITIGFEDGVCVHTGDIRPYDYDQSLGDSIVEVLAEMVIMLCFFSQMFPQSRFTIDITQSVAITGVEQMICIN